MTPQELAEMQVHLSKLQVCITALAILLGPLFGVIFTLWFQSRKEKKDAKLQLFLTLISERKANVSTQVAQALNKIDVIFSESEKIKNLWHECYTLLHQPPGEPRAHKWLELLKAMSEELHYSHLSQLDLDKFYIPQGHIDDDELRRKTFQQWSRVLENTERFLVEQKNSGEELEG